ncbi:hypothetical protein [Paenibacillus sp. HJGM_3]|uniref:hypothetical protein n=1 Tax=Paenibacillus sp. HJGM_3 TaxID=3379816 RepID=UPI00385D44B5
MARGVRTEEMDLTEDTVKVEPSLEREAEMSARSAAKQLKAMPKKTIFIPIDPLNPDDKVAVVGFNGVFYTIPRDQEFEVPEAVYEIWKDSERRTREVYKRVDESTRKEVRVV